MTYPPLASTATQALTFTHDTDVKPLASTSLVLLHTSVGPDFEKVIAWPFSSTATQKVVEGHEIPEAAIDTASGVYFVKELPLYRIATPAVVVMTQKFVLAHDTPL
jgi:hypothetical protein